MHKHLDLCVISHFPNPWSSTGHRLLFPTVRTSLPLWEQQPCHQEAQTEVIDWQCMTGAYRTQWSGTGCGGLRIHDGTISLREKHETREGLHDSRIPPHLVHTRRRKVYGPIRSRCRRGSGGSEAGELARCLTDLYTSARWKKKTMGSRHQRNAV